MLVPSHMPELSWMMPAPRSTLTTVSNNLKRSSGEFLLNTHSHATQHISPLSNYRRPWITYTMYYVWHWPFVEQAVCGGVWPWPGHQRAADQRGPAGVPWRNEGQLQRPGQRAVRHHARASKHELSTSVTNIGIHHCLFISRFWLFVHFGRICCVCFDCNTGKTV